MASNTASKSCLTVGRISSIIGAISSPTSDSISVMECFNVSILSAVVFDASSVASSVPSAFATATANSSKFSEPLCNADTMSVAILPPKASIARELASVCDVALVMESSKSSQSALASVPAIAESSKDFFIAISTALESMPCFSKVIIMAMASSIE